MTGRAHELAALVDPAEWRITPEVWPRGWQPHWRGLWVLGLGCQRAFAPTEGQPVHGIDDLPATLVLLHDEAPAILLAHEPDIFPKVPRRVALTLAGHTHGGQIRLGRWTPVVPSIYGSRYVWGHIHEDWRDLVVSGGLGCSGLPIRVGRTPEMTVVQLG